MALVIMAGGRNLRYDRDLTKCATDLGLPSTSCMIELIGRKLWTLKEIGNLQYNISYTYHIHPLT